MAQLNVTESARKFEGKILSVRVDRVEIAEGVFASREVVEHRPAVCVLPFDKEGNVYLVRQYRYAVGEALLEAPAGLMEEGETPEQAALRELREETGALGTVEPVGEFFPTPGYCEEKVYFFVARVESFGETEPDEDEFLQTVRMPFSEFFEACRNGMLRDGKTVALALRSVDAAGFSIKKGENGNVKA